MDEKLDKLLIEDKELSFPPRARSIGELFPVLSDDDEYSFGSSDEESDNDEPHTVSRMVLMRKHRDSQSQGESPAYFLKEHAYNPRLAELEAYCGMLCRFLATRRLVPNTRPYIDDNGRITRVSSKAIPNFSSNYENPLLLNNLLIDSSIINEEYRIRSAQLFTRKLIDYYDSKDTTAARIKRYVSRGLTSSIFDNSSTQYSTRHFLLQYFNDPAQFSAESVLARLQERRDYLIYRITNFPDLQEEYYHLNRVIRILEGFYTIVPEGSKPIALSIKTLETLDRQVRAQGVDLEHYGEEHGGELGDVIGGIHHAMRVQDLINYRIISGLGVSLTTRYIFKEADGHNSNMSKDGKILDFDWTKSNILYGFRTNDVFSSSLRNPDSTHFACNEYNIKHFPDIDEPGLFYWPTKQPDLRNILLNGLSEYLSRIEKEIVESDYLFSIVPAQLLLDAFNLIESSYLPNRDKTYSEKVSNFFHGAYLQLNGMITRRSGNTLIVKEKINGVFSILIDQVSQFIDQAYMGVDPLDGREIVRQIKMLNSSIDILFNYYNELRDEAKEFTNSALFKIITKIHPITEKEIEDTLQKSDDFIHFLKSEIESFLADHDTTFDQFERNSFTIEDNTNYKLLASHPVFIFHKYKTFLKYVLTDPEVYRVFAEMNISQYSSSSSSSSPSSSSSSSSSSGEHSENLHERLITDEYSRTEEIRQALLSMSDFKSFLMEHGQFAFELIQGEFQEEREAYSKKTTHQSYYQRLINALDPGEIEAKFNELFRMCTEEEVCSSDSDDLLLMLRI